MKLDEEKKMTFIIAAIVIAVIALFVIFAMIDNCEGDDTYSKTCKVCHRTFTDTGKNSNTRNITNTGMCNSCYINFKGATGANNLDEDEIDGTCVILTAIYTQNLHPTMGGGFHFF